MLTVQQTLSAGDFEIVQTKGMLSRAAINTSSTGSVWLAGILEDETGAAEVRAWPSAYSEYASVLTPHCVIQTTVRVEHPDERPTCLVIQDVAGVAPQDADALAVAVEKRHAEDGSDSTTPADKGISNLAPKAVARRGTVQGEVHLLRLPIWCAGRTTRPASDEWREVGSLYRGTVSVLEPLGPLVVRDCLLVMHLADLYREHGQTVPLSLGEAALAQAYGDKGGSQRELVKDSLMRLKVTAFHHRYRLRGADGERHDAEITWSILDQVATTTLSGGVGWVKLSDALVRFIENGQFTSLDSPCLHELVRRSDQAAHLWMFLQSESNLGKGREYLLFSAPEGEPSVIRDTPAISDLLQLTRARRRDVVREVRQAARIVCETDRAYQIDVKAARGRGMWKLVVTRNAKQQDRYQETRQLGTGGRAGWVLGDAQLGTGGRATSHDSPAEQPISTTYRLYTVNNLPLRDTPRATGFAPTTDRR